MRSYITALLLCLSPMLLAGQVVEGDIPSVQRSTDKVKIDGKNYYIHIVKSGETLYSISKAYEVSQSDIAVNNPDIYNGLKIGQALKIPVRASESKGTDDYIYHIVAKGETLYSISRRYNIPVDVLTSINPEVKDGLLVSQVILIPRNLMIPEAKKPAADTVQFIMHEVQKGEGLLAVARRYNIDAKTIETYNQEVLKDGLKLGEYLRIPAVKQHPADSLMVTSKPEPVAFFSTCKSNFRYNGQPFDISLLLPFSQGSAVDSDELIDEAEEVKMDPGTTNTLESSRITSQETLTSLNFYEGFLLAVDSMKKAGVSMNINVFDTKHQPEEVTSILNKGKLDKSNIIIGPLFVNEIKPVVAYAERKSIPMVSPLYSGNEVISEYPGLISVNQGYGEQLEVFIKNFKFSDTCHYVVIYDMEKLLTGPIQNFSSALNQRIRESGVRVDSVVHQTAAMKSEEVQAKLHSYMKADGCNVVIIPSQDEPFVSDLLGQLYAVKSLNGLKMIVYGPARWQKMKNVPPDYLYKLNARVFTPFYVDYSRDEVKRFVASFRDRYRAEPNQFSFLGYDVGIYFISALKTYGPDFTKCLKDFQKDMLQSTFTFDVVSNESRLSNTHQFIIGYTDDYDLVRIIP